MDLGRALRKASADVEAAKRGLDEARRVLERARTLENQYRRLLKGGTGTGPQAPREDDTPEPP
jgi:hypothetical protein